MIENNEKTSISVALGNDDLKDMMISILNIFQHIKVNIDVTSVQIGQEHYKNDQHGGILPSNLDIIDKNKILFKAYTSKPSIENKVKNFDLLIKEKYSIHSTINIFCNKHSWKSENNIKKFCIVHTNKTNAQSDISYQYNLDFFENIEYIDNQELVKTIQIAIDLKNKLSFDKIIFIKTADPYNKVENFLISTIKELKNNISNQEIEILDQESVTNMIFSQSISQKTIFITDYLYGNFLCSAILELYKNFYGSKLCFGDNHQIFEALKFRNDSYNQNIYSITYTLTNLLEYLGYNTNASLIYNSMNYIIEENFKKKIIEEDYQEFIKKLIKFLEKKPKNLEEYKESRIKNYNYPDVDNAKDIIETLVGVDIFIKTKNNNENCLAKDINKATKETSLKLQMIISNGAKIWPKNNKDDLIKSSLEAKNNKIENLPSQLYSLRFISSSNDKTSSENDIIQLLQVLLENNISFIKIQNLYLFNNKLGFSIPYNM